MTRLPAAIRRFRRDSSGAVAVEFMLIAPLLFALLFGIVVMGYLIGLSHSVSQLAAGAARASVAGLDRTERTGLAQAYLAQAGARYPLLNESALQTDVVIEGPDAPAITVSVVYDIDGSILDLANGFLGLGIKDISRDAYLAY